MCMGDSVTLRHLKRLLSENRWRRGPPDRTITHKDANCFDLFSDPQALNDFLHGTNELENEDLLISSSGETSLFADAPSPVSLLADNTPSQDTPPPGCVDLSFLEEALLGSPEGGGAPGVGGAGRAEEEEEEEACDILQQSLQEADITEQTLVLEAGLAPPSESLSLYPPGTAAVEPPQPSLLAVGPGCPSLKPAAPQMMGLLPGTVFPAPPPDASFSLSPRPGLRHAHPEGPAQPDGAPPAGPHAEGHGRPRHPASPGAPPHPAQAADQHPAPPGADQPKAPPDRRRPPASRSCRARRRPTSCCPPPWAPNSRPPPPNLSKPLSLQLLNQGGSIVIQPPGLLQGHNQFLLPGQTPVSVPQPPSAARPLLAAASPQGPSARGGGAPSSGQLLAVRQGTLLSGPLQLQSTPPTVFQMPAQLAGTYPPQGQGQRGTLLHSAALGNQITLINSPAMLAPDLASISIVNGPSVVHGLPFAPPAQHTLAAAPQDKPLNLPQTSVLLLPDRTGSEERGSVEEPFLHLTQPNQQPLLQPPPTELHMPPAVVTLLQPLPEAPLQHDPAPLPKHLMPQTEEQPLQKEVLNMLPQKQLLLHQMHQQACGLPSIPTDSSSGTLPVQLSPPSSSPPPANQREDSAPSLPAMGQTLALAVTPSPTVVTTPTHPGAEQTGTLIGQNTLGPPPVRFPSPPGGPRAGHGKAAAAAAAQVRAAGLGGSVPSPLPAGLSVQLQPVSLPAPLGPRVQPGMPIQTLVQQRPQELAAGVAVDGSMFAPAARHTHRQPNLEAPVQAVPQPRTQVTACGESEREERLTLAMRRHRLQQQLCQDHGAVLDPDACSPFLSLEDAVSRLLPYHTCAGHLPGQAGFLTVDQQFDTVSGILLKRTKDMLNKYRQLLLGEAQQVSPSAEMVMLERLFLQAERGVLGEERRKARIDPDSFLLSLRKPASGSNEAAPSITSPFLRTGSPPSSPAWALLSNRPPGLKTYRSSSRGALKLTIKQESGSRKVVHNSACDGALSATPLHKQDCAGRLTNGGGVPSGRGLELWEAPQPQTGHPQPAACPPPPKTTAEEAQHPKNSGGIAEAQMAAVNSRTPPDSRTTAKTQTAATPEPPSPDPVLCPPEPKRLRPDTHQGLPSPLPLPDDSTLSEHLQSAIDSILELQRLQGPPQDRRGSSVLEQAVSSILEGHL
ncbi:hypothetical protein SKAU_G00332150 [Synaphobranchus kaupii]|uniref:GLTSCR protein conserved domain-containing protein n=1 Tax=Synaphobranchus kaupii TaxID=118154 RepID=A0A9Q1EL90_SYNKA|nr:hypothetical protein SKAU_G00332150 [Synaphobranchus kaupii]